MVNVGVVKRGAIGYYLKEQGLTHEEYYSVSGMEVGAWTGRGAEELGVSGEVGSDDFNAVMDGRDPRSGEVLSSYFGRRKVFGIDTTFRAPKSVSLVFALGDPDHVSAVREAHAHAVQRSLEYLEERAIGGREGPQGAIKVRGRGSIASVWNHATSRAGDPTLHTHVVHANMIHADSGKWLTLDSNKIHQHAKTAGMLYQAELRRELTMSLGVEWTEVVNGCADIVGIPREVIEHFSKRRYQMRAWVDEQIDDADSKTKSHSADAMQAAALETRRTKVSEPNADAFKRWVREAESIGFGAEQIRAACPGKTDIELDIDYAQLAADVNSGNGATSRRATFSRLVVVEEFANRLPATAGADLAEELADRWLEAYGIPLRQNKFANLGNFRVARSGEQAYTTARVLEKEAAVLSNAFSGLGKRVAKLSDKNLDLVSALARKRGLSDDQVEMVRQIHGSGNGVDIVIGDAGTGKTFALNFSREVFENGGFTVIGAAPTHAAKEQLREGAGIQSDTVAQINADLKRKGDMAVFRGGKRTALIIDEAAMVPTEEIADVISAAKRVGAKVVLVGDSKQLPPVKAGGWFDLVAERIEPARLTQNFRQRAGTPERQVADLMAAGRSDEAFEIAMDSGMVDVEPEEDVAIARLVKESMADSLRDERAGRGSESLIVAGTNDEANKINAAIQAERRALHTYAREEPNYNGEPFFYEGEPVIFRRNFREELGVTNRERGVVLGTNESGELLVRMERDGGATVVAVPHAIASDRSKFTLGYASTVHVAQGRTVDRCYVLASSGMDANLYYVALTRARTKTRVFATERYCDLQVGFGDAQDLNTRTKREMGRSRSEGAATGYGEPSARVAADEAVKQSRGHGMSL